METTVFAILVLALLTWQDRAGVAAISALMLVCTTGDCHPLVAAVPQQALAAGSPGRHPPGRWAAMRTGPRFPLAGKGLMPLLLVGVGSPAWLGCTGGLRLVRPDWEVLCLIGAGW